jgi:predicted dehydrogenase
MDSSTSPASASTRPTSVAFVGAGPTGKAHMQAFRDVPGVQVVGIMNRSRAKAEAVAAELGICSVHDSISKLYQETKADLIVVTVSILSVRSVLLECMAFPWVILVEKPPGIDLKEADELLTEARRLGARIFVAMNRRAMSSTRLALADLANNQERRFIQVCGQEDAERLATVHPPEVVSRAMYANSIHCIDYLRIFGRGEVTSVQVPGRWDPVEKSPVSAWITFSSGDIGSYIGVWDAPSPWSVSITTASKRWEMRPLEKAGNQLRGQYVLTPHEPHEWDRLFKPGFRWQAEECVKAVHGLPSQAVTLEDAVATMSLIAHIYA